MLQNDCVLGTPKALNPSQTMGESTNLHTFPRVDETRLEPLDSKPCFQRSSLGPTSNGALVVESCEML